MANQNKTDIGLIGLAVMGENLALNMESKGWHVSVYNRTVPGVEEGVVDRFMNGRAKGKNIEGFTDIKAFVESIATPRKIMMMVRAGSPVDELMDQLFHHARRIGESVAGSEACLAEHCGESAGRNSLLPVGRPCRVGTFCEDDSQRYRIR